MSIGNAVVCLSGLVVTARVFAVLRGKLDRWLKARRFRRQLEHLTSEDVDAMRRIDSWSKQAEEDR